VTPLYEAGKYDEASDRGRELLANDPPFPALFYNVACCESLAGRTDDAIEHLRRAFAGSESLRELAKTDADLDPIRDEPGFKELLAE
jgi:tetratricopeptide (TPR) repeat protein